MPIAVIIAGTAPTSTIAFPPWQADFAAPQHSCDGRFGALIDSGWRSVNTAPMDMEEYLPKKADDPLARLMAQDLDPFSVAELQARITALEGEIARTRQKMNAAVNHKASAEALFRK